MIWRFADCELDEQLYQLRRAGTPVQIEPKVFDVLLHLLRHRDEVVSKDALLDALWPGEAVTESVLPRCVAAARRAVGDDRTTQAVIRTVHGRGYRFVAPLEAAAPTAAAAVPAAPPAPAEAIPAADAFVGRDAALARLDAALAEVRAGRGRVVLLVGEPGIGKTRTAGELAARVTAAGMPWLAGRCFEGEGAPAFWPWLQVLRRCADADPPETLAADLGPGAADVAALVPEIGARGVKGPDATPAEGEQARFRLFDAIGRWLRRRAARGPLAVFLDDLHWADPDSLALLRFLATELRESPVLLVASYRDVEVRRAHPLAEGLAALAREPGCERLALRGLAPEAVTALVERTLGRPVDADLAAAVADLTEGNPFFVVEIARLLGERGEAVPATAMASLALPQSVRDVVGRRLDALSPECNALLRVAAVVGRTFSTPLLERASDVAGEPLLELLAEALAADVLVPVPEGVGHYGFQHALTRQTLYDELNVPQRVRLHRRVGEALETVVAGAEDAHVAELAHHFFVAAPGGDVDKAVDYAVRAAEQARDRFAYAESARHYTLALEVLPLAVPLDEARRCALLCALGDARGLGGERQTARARFVEAAELARRIGRNDLLARAAVGHRGFGEMGAPPDGPTIALLEEALDVVGDAWPVERARVLARLTGTPPHSASMETRERFSLEALALAEASGDRWAIVDALSARYWASLGPDRVAERLAVGAHGLALATRWGDQRVEILAREARIGAHLVRGDMVAAGEEIDAYARLADALRMPLFQFLAGVIQASFALNQGRFAEAEAHRERALARGRGRVAYAEMLELGQRLWQSAQRGEPPLAMTADGALGRLQEEFAGIARLSRIMETGRGFQRGEVAEARAAWEELAAEEFDDLVRDEHWLFSVAALIDLASVLADVPRLERLYGMLRPYADLTVCHDLLRVVAGSVEGALGLAALEAGQSGDAVAHYERAVARESEMGLRPARVRALTGLARAHARRAARGDAQRSTRLRREADAEAAALGLRPGVIGLLTPRPADD